MIKKLKRFLLDPNARLGYLTKMGLTHCMSDEKYLKKKFKIELGYELNLENPQTFNEKLQWLKLHDRKPEYTVMADKYLARSYVLEKLKNETYISGGVTDDEINYNEYLIPLLGVWNSPDEIDFDKLPNQFVLKCNHDSGGLVVVRDKSKMDKSAVKKKLEKSLKRNYYWVSREWPYKDIHGKIICEKFMRDKSSDQGLTDYKFYCFNGDPALLYVSVGLENHATTQIRFLNRDYLDVPFGRSDYKKLEELPPKPKHFNEMLEIARRLSAGISFLRVDLYEIEDKVYFSELTFTPCGGFMPFEPKEWDKKLGEMLDITAASHSKE